MNGVLRRRVVLVVFDRFELLDFAGVRTALNEANRIVPGAYAVTVAAPDAGPVRCEAGTQVIPDSDLGAIESLDTLVIPGGSGARDPALARRMRGDVERLIDRAGRVVTICTGAFLVAEYHPDPGLPRVTHWAYQDEFVERFPDLAIDRDSLYSGAGKFWSSGGVTAGIDLLLHLIELDLGAEVATRVARAMVVYVRRSGSQRQFSEPLRLQHSGDPLVDRLTRFVHDNLQRPLRVDDLAEAAAVSGRSLFRAFRARGLGTPADFIVRVRIDLARQLLESSPASAKRISDRVGFTNYDGFRRAFERSLGISPSEYRARFRARQ